jgi:hypothetical protein
LLSYWNSDTLVLAMTGARPFGAGDNPAIPQLVADLAQRAQIPTPKVYIVESAEPNAFATGRDPEHGVVAVTTGIMRTLNHDELAGVIAHELSHIKNRDTLVSAISASMAGVITQFAYLLRWSSLLGGNRQRGGTSMLSSLALMIVAPLAATAADPIATAGINRAAVLRLEAEVMEVVVFDEEVVPAHLHAHARAVVDVAMPHSIVHAIQADAAGVLVEDAHVMDVAVLDGMTGSGECFAITTAEADAVAAGEADLAVRDADVFALADADTAAVESADLGDDALFDEAVLRPLEGDGTAVAASEREAADGDVFGTFDFEEGVGEGEADVT